MLPWSGSRRLVRMYILPGIRVASFFPSGYAIFHVRRSWCISASTLRGRTTNRAEFMCFPPQRLTRLHSCYHTKITYFYCSKGAPVIWLPSARRSILGSLPTDANSEMERWQGAMSAVSREREGIVDYTGLCLSAEMLNSMLELVNQHRSRNQQERSRSYIRPCRKICSTRTVSIKTICYIPHDKGYVGD